MSIVLSILQATLPIMRYIAVVSVIAAAASVIAWRFVTIYPYRVVIAHRRAGKDPILSFDRAGRYKMQSGVEVFRLWREKIGRKKVEIMPPDSKYIYGGKSMFINRMILPLYEDSGRYYPANISFEKDHFTIKPIPHSMELDRIALHNQIEAWHDTRSGFEKMRPLLIGAGLIAIIFLIIILASKGGDIFAGIKGAFGG